MYCSIAGFIEDWNQEAALTQSLMDVLQNGTLRQQVSSDDRTLGRIAWHIVTSTPGMLIEFGIKVPLVENAKTVPESAKEIAGAFRRVSTELST